MQIKELALLFEPMQPGSFAERRYEMCKSCENFMGRSKMCKICNCMMPLKARLPSQTCPAGKWGPEE
jgi:hypothetical protein